MSKAERERNKATAQTNILKSYDDVVGGMELSESLHNRLVFVFLRELIEERVCDFFFWGGGVQFFLNLLPLST